MDSKITQLRLISFLEGLSFLVLLFIAMPIKYILENPIVVKYAGMTHGLLFIIFVYSLYQTSREQNWTFKFTFIAFVSSLVPFAPFWLEKKLKVLDRKLAVEKNQ